MKEPGVLVVKEAYDRRVAQLLAKVADRQKHLDLAEDRNEMLADALASAKQKIKQLEYAYGALLTEHTALLKEKA